MAGGVSRISSYLQEHPYDASVKAVPKRFLCVASDESTRRCCSELLGAGWEMVLAPTPEAALGALGDTDGIRVAMVHLNTENRGAVEALVESYGAIEWIAVTEKSDLEDGSIRGVISRLFYDYHTLPISADRLRVMLGHACGMAVLRRTSRSNGQDDWNNGTEFPMIGWSEPMREIYSMIEKVAAADFPVLITGRSGTGKELVARAIHDRSGRSTQPLVAVNCGAVVPTLIQSELFGHEKGSFTSADKRREGHFEIAQGGTIFLDEISELPLETQANLLRVLEEKFIRRVGGSRSIPVDVRVIAATNRDLAQEVATGRFREDLLYRLSVIHVEVPTLAERPTDIEMLANFYLQKLAPEVKSRARGFSNAAISAMLAHSWPGNVRELVNRIKRAALMCENRMIQPDDLNLTPLHGQPRGGDGAPLMTLRKVKEQAERDALIQTMHYAKSNISVAARVLGVSRVTLYNLLKKYELR